VNLLHFDEGVVACG